MLCGATIADPASILSDSIGFRWNIRARLASAGDSQMMEMSHVPPFLADTPRRPSACRLRFAKRRDQPVRKRDRARRRRRDDRSEEHTSELQSLMRISYAVFCLKKKKKKIQ